MTAPRVAVVGGGIFGVTAAVKLAQRGVAVELFEQYGDLLMAASGINQYRLHRGYHYPRSPETVVSCRDSEQQFVAEYGPAVIGDCAHYYGIAKDNSLTTAERYLEFCREHGLEHEPACSELIKQHSVSLCVKVRESVFDPETLRSLCWQKLQAQGVPVHVNTRVALEELSVFDRIIVATYAASNTLLDGHPRAQHRYQFELCEKPVVRLPDVFQGKSLVIMDGPFMCVDPFGRTGLFVMGNVVHAIHQTQVGKAPVIEEPYQGLLNRGVVHHPPVTNFRKFIAAASDFIEGIEQAEHIGSMFTVRTVLPSKDETDERPTIVRAVGDRIITMFSGKIGTCVQAADEVVALVMHPRPARHAVGAPS